MRYTIFFLCSFAHLYEGNLKSCRSAVSFLLLFMVPCFDLQKFSEIPAKNSFFEDEMMLQSQVIPRLTDVLVLKHCHTIFFC